MPHTLNQFITSYQTVINQHHNFPTKGWTFKMSVYNQSRIEAEVECQQANQIPKGRLPAPGNDLIDNNRSIEVLILLIFDDRFKQVKRFIRIKYFMEFDF